MKGLTHARLILYSLVLGLLPLAFVAMNYSSTKTKQDRLQYALSEACIEATNKNAKEFLNKQTRAQFRDSDHFYIDKEIETITPLKTEVETLQKVLTRGYHPELETFRRRLQFHTAGQNSISFVEGNVKSYTDFQETQESLAHPVEADLADIKAILSRIEGVPLDDQEPALKRPHLIITDWKMEKRKGPTQDAYVVDVKLIKREYLK